MSKELAQAMLMNRELNPVINEGARVAALAMARVRTAAFRQLQTGERQPLRRIVYDTLFQPLLKGMMVGHLMGDRRASLFVPKELKLAVYDDMLKSLSAKRKINIKKLQQDYEARAFRVVTDLGRKVDDELQDTVDELLTQGAHIGEAVDTLKTKFDKLGVSTSSSSSIETLFRTQLQTTYNAARWKFDQDPDIQEILWGYKYVTVGDDRVRPEHAELEGVQLPKDDPFWLRFWPPNGWNCRCQVIPIFEERKVVKAPADIAPDPGFDFNAGLVLVLAFDPSQPRGADGKWGGGGEKVTLEGLKPHKSGNKAYKEIPLREASKEQQSEVAAALLKSGKTFITDASMQEIPLEDTFAVQTYIKTSTLKRHVIGMGGEHKGAIKAYKFKGKYFLEDGHHRAVAALINEQTKVKGLVIELAFDPNQTRDYHGRFASDKGGDTGSTGAVSRHKRTPKPKLSDRAARAKAAHKRSTAEKQRHAEANEATLAKALSAQQSDNNSAMDVTMKGAGKLHGIELKTMVDNGNDKITMHPNSRRRKEDWKAQSSKREIHTVVIDDRDKFGNKHQYSGHRIYYKRGVGAFRVGKMHKVKDMAELKRIINTPQAKLPESAK